MLGNIQPKYRSSYKMIQLAALCKVSYISKYSMDVILKPIVEDVKLVSFMFANMQIYLYRESLNKGHSGNCAILLFYFSIIYTGKWVHFHC